MRATVDKRAVYGGPRVNTTRNKKIKIKSALPMQNSKIRVGFRHQDEMKYFCCQKTRSSSSFYCYGPVTFLIIKKPQKEQVKGRIILD